jgi:hypothetical protein
VPGVSGNADVVAAIYAAMADADLDAVLERCSPDVTIIQAEELPWGGRYVGRDGLFEFATKLVTTIDSKVTAEGLFEAGDRVVQRGRTRGTVRATGVAFDVAEVHVWTLREGLVVAAEFFIDTPAMIEALAVSATGPTAGARAPLR